jgi:hypothetical protein
VFPTFHIATAFLNRPTSDHRGRIGTPEYKVTAVRIEQLAHADVGDLSCL